MVDLCIKNGARPVFLVLRDNPAFTRDLREGLDRLGRGDAAGAIPPLLRMNEGEWTLMASPFLAQAYRLIGDQVRADAALRVKPPTGPLDADGGVPIRLDVHYNEVMREVAAERGVDLVDGAALLEAMPEVFIDACHFNAAGHRALGHLVAERLAPYVQ